jgi:hypothetical protein
MISNLLDHGDNVDNAELNLCSHLYNSAVTRDELLWRHTEI